MKNAPATVTLPSDGSNVALRSTLSPTSEFMRYFTAGWMVRYIFRGGSGLVFDEKAVASGLRAKILNAFSGPGRKFLGRLNTGKAEAEMIKMKELDAVGYSASLGLGSMLLTTSYASNVYADIKTVFSESVGEEFGKPASEITFSDIRRSDNRIVKKTIENFWEKLASRLATDLLFFPAAMLRHDAAGDIMLGVKGMQLFADTWKRKTTMFEDLVTFINNKINPRNGLGQPISVGEIFDLYQHYEQAYNPSKSFTNVLEHGTGEGARWAQSQPIFTRLTELMNLTYAYKHSSLIDPTTGHAVHQADFALPKFIYLLGHDLIDVNAPAQTLATIEIANRYGIPAVKEMQSMLARGEKLDAIETRFPVEPHINKIEAVDPGKKNGVIAKGSTVQLDQAEVPASRNVALSGMEHSTLTPAHGTTIA